MKAVIQRCSEGSVTVEGQVVGSIGDGLVVFLAIAKDDTEKDLLYVINKITNVRCFKNEEGKLDLCLQDKNAEILLVSQFSLYGDCTKGRRPSFSEAAPPRIAEYFYLKAIQILQNRGIRVATGKFQHSMAVSLINDGPLTLIITSPMKT